MNPLKQLQEYGQSIWMDDIRRSIIHDGTLDTLIERDGLRGITSNPSIFQKAIAESDDYDDAIAQAVEAGQGVDEMYEALVIEDIQNAADRFRPLFDGSDGKHGWVSLEVSPHLADDTDGTIAEARRLWQRLDRPNVFIKVPGTEAGLPAITQLISEGINVNVTLLFGLPRYRRVIEAYLGGLEARANLKQPLAPVASVASFFLSRIDVKVDAMLDDIAEKESGDRAELARSLRGKVAVASAQVAYQIYKEMFSAEHYLTLESMGAQTQRALWASTSTKDPSYSDVKYVEALIGPDTVNTLPTETLDAYRDHGKPALRLEQDIEDAYACIEQLETLGIDLDQVTYELEREGVEKFVKPFDSLMQTLKDAAESAAPAS